MNTELTGLGWNEEWAEAWKALNNDQLMPGRVIADHGQFYRVALPQELPAEASGRLYFALKLPEMPKIGDWVGVQLLDNGHCTIQETLPRKSEISRKRPGDQYERQVLAANIDLAFLVQALDHDFSPERLRRYIFQLQKEGIQSVILLNKADKAEDLDSKLKELESFNCEIIVASAKEHKGVDKIADRIKAGETAVFLGSSGVGKSTLTNALLGEQRQATKTVRDEDSKGRHTTTHRELFVLPNGGLIVDTPGLRELQLWGSEDDLGLMFPEIEALAAQCKFSDCSHTHETGCAILEAQRTGALDKAELEAYFKFQNELRYLNAKVNVDAARERAQDHKKSQKAFNHVIKDRRKRKI